MTDLRERIPSLSNNSYTPLELNNATRVENANVQFENNSQIDSKIRNVKVGNGSVTDGGSTFRVTTPAQADGNQSLETAQVASYTAGLTGKMGMYIQKSENPVGFMETLYGGDVFSNELILRWNSDGTQEFIRRREGVDASIPQSDWDASTTAKEVTDENGDVVETPDELFRRAEP